ncbi:hypothetical protein ACQPZ2_00190 [Nocardia pseudovaccinii]|uniref:acyl-CoA-like ligand-binding transcription factor n=1 Tax=Nocardia pseudovaccinii TaxID=189540 RepID=UPI003D8A775A
MFRTDVAEPAEHFTGAGIVVLGNSDLPHVHRDIEGDHRHEVIFADDDLYDGLLREAFDNRAPHDRPADLLLRVLGQLSGAAAWSFPLDHELTRVRARLIAEVPALRAGALLRNAALQQQLAGALRTAYPDDIDTVQAAALTGALVGAVDAVLNSVAAHGAAAESVSAVVDEAARIALRGHLSDDRTG